MANTFDQFDQPEANPFDQFGEPRQTQTTPIPIRSPGVQAFVGGALEGVPILGPTLLKLGGVRRPKEVAEAMIQDDPALSNKNGKLVTNVNSELYRMWKSKTIPVKRVSEGRYKLEA